jgi:ABC-type Mn2+/Zn2+ transport system permease subunit
MIAPALENWLEKNVFLNSSDIPATTMAGAALSYLVALGQQRWFKFALVFFTGIVIGVSIEWLSRKSDERKAFELRSLGSKVTLR